MGMGMPETRYARSGDVMIAYQVLGEGPAHCPKVYGGSQELRAAPSGRSAPSLTASARLISSTLT